MITPIIAEVAASSSTALVGSISAGLAVIGAGIGVGLVGAKVAEACGRNPAASNKVLVMGIIFASLVEGVALIAIFMK